MPAFYPIVGESPKILILGSMPGQRSLEESRYYAHPQNAFWWIMTKILNVPETLGYEEKCECLRSADFALWDVLYDCQRPGSLDSNIARASEQPNNFVDFFENYNQINLIAFNGGAAMKIFIRHCSEAVLSNSKIKCVQLPSSSAAHASMTRDEKLKIWQEKLSI